MSKRSGRGAKGIPASIFRNAGTYKRYRKYGTTYEGFAVRKRNKPKNVKPAK
jgi:hypothetical protein